MIRLVLAFALLIVSAPALANRNVWVNGLPLNWAHLAQLDHAHCGRIPNGSYWFDYRTGVWGYSGNPRPRGHIADNCHGGGAMAGHRLHRGAFGTYMSDGPCAFVNGVPVRRC